MPADFDLYRRGNTWLHTLDPRVKLAFVTTASLLTFLWPRIPVALGVIAVCLVLLWRAGTPVARTAGFLRGMAIFLLTVFVLTALFVDGPGASLVRVGPIRITASALVQGGLLATRLLALALIFLLWLTVTDQAAMVHGFVTLGMPYEWGLTLVLALRYLPVLAGLFVQVREAQQARGLDLVEQGFWRRLRSYGPVLIAVVIGTLRHGERLGWALEARGLGGPNIRRTTFRPLRMRWVDAVALLLMALVFAAAILMRFF